MPAQSMQQEDTYAQQGHKAMKSLTQIVLEDWQ